MRGSPRLVLGLAALLVLLAFAGPGRAQGAQADLGLEKLVVQGVPRAGGPTSIDVVVRNSGPAAAAAFDVFFGIDDAMHPLNGTNDTSTYSYPVNAAVFQVEGDCAQVVGAPLAVGCALRATLVWNVSDAQAGGHAVVVHVSPGAGAADPNDSNDTARQDVFVELHRLSVTLDPRDDVAKEVRAGDALPYRASVLNQGNVVESVAMSLTSENWTQGQSVLPSSLRLAPGERGSVLALLRAPSEAASAPDGDGTLKARNQSTPLGNGTVRLPAAHASGTLEPAYGFALTSAGDALVDPGGANDQTVRVRDTGSTEDALRLSVSGGAAGWTLILPAPFAVVPAGADAMGELAVQARADASVPPGSFVNATLTATSVNRDSLRQSLQVTFRASAPDLVLGNVTFDKGALYVGDIVALRVEVRNGGNLGLAKPARVTLTAAQGATGTVVAEQVVNDVAPGDLRILQLAWNTAGFRGAYDLALKLDASDDVVELHEDNNARTFPVVVRTAGLDVEAPGMRTATAGQRLDYAEGATFRVRNLGNAAESVRVTLSTTQGWLAQTRTVDLAPGEARALPFTLQVPVRPGTVREGLTGTATLLNRTLTSVSNDTQVNIRDDDPPVVQAIEAPDFVELGQPATFRATLTDAVGIRSAELTLRQPDGTLQRVPLVPEGEDRYQADVVLAQPGAVSFWLTAIDATPGNNTSSTQANPGAVLVGVRTAPLVELISPTRGASVRPGTQVQLRITDVHGIGSVSVRDGARSFELQAPYVISTAGWSEGGHDLNVTARNRFGNQASLAFALVIDSLPPAVRDARADPARPAPGQPFTVTASASGDAVRAALQVRQGGKVLREVPAELTGQVASARLTLDAGTYTLTIRVEDEAGNAAGSDVDVTVGGGSLPGFEGWAVLVASLGAVLLARQRR